jgi:hypothetical protein
MEERGGKGMTGHVSSVDGSAQAHEEAAMAMEERGKERMTGHVGS